MAGHFFGLFAGGDRNSKPDYSMDRLQALHSRLQLIKDREKDDEEKNGETTVEVIRQITEALLWGEQNGHDDNFFDFFCEKSILADFVRVLGKPRVPQTVKVQLLQTLSMLIQNIRRDTSLYYLFSNNHVNHLISTQLDFSDEEILSYYISFLKSLALRLNKETITFFFNEHSQQFPLYTKAVRFLGHHDQMVRTSVQTLTLQVLRLEDAKMQKFVLEYSSKEYFPNLSIHLRGLWVRLDAAVQRAAASPRDSTAVAAVQEANEQQQDVVMYVGDVLGLGIDDLSNALADNVLQHACYPTLLGGLLPVQEAQEVSTGTSLDESECQMQPAEHLSKACAVFLLNQLFDGCQSRPLLGPLAGALLRRRLPLGLLGRLRSPPPPMEFSFETESSDQLGTDANDAAGGSSSSTSLASPTAVEKLSRKHGEELGPSDASIHSELLRLLAGSSGDSCVLLVAGLMRACLSCSSIISHDLLEEGGLMPPASAADPSPSIVQMFSPYNSERVDADGSLEVLLKVAQALENHTTLRIVVIQGLCRLCLDLALAPQARSLGECSWRTATLSAVKSAMRSAAHQVRKYLHGTLTDSFLDIFAEEWERDSSIPSQALREACSSKYCLLPALGQGSGPGGPPLAWNLPATDSERQQASKAIRSLLIFRHLHKDLCSKSPGPENRSALPPAAPPSGGIVTTSALNSSGESLAERSPLGIPEEVADGYAEGKDLKLGRQDRIVCGVVTPEGRHTRYLVLHQFVLLLAQPDIIKKPGWAVARTLIALRHVDAQIDHAEPRMLRIFLRLPKGAQCPGEASVHDSEHSESSSCFVLNLCFEDQRRCLSAEAHLKRRTQEIRHRLTKNVEAFIDGLCAQDSEGDG